MGHIDVFMPHVITPKHKSLGKDDGAAHGQALDYLQQSCLPLSDGVSQPLLSNSRR